MKQAVDGYMCVHVQQVFPLQKAPKRRRDHSLPTCVCWFVLLDDLCFDKACLGRTLRIILVQTVYQELGKQHFHTFVFVILGRS